MTDKRTYYFGCLGEKGHYMHPYIRRGELPGVNYRVIEYIDGMYTPGGQLEQGAAQFSMVGPLTIIAWHDYTIDSRPGSNSVIIGYDFTGTRAEMIWDMFKDFTIRFPQVIKRQTAPINVADFGIVYKPNPTTNLAAIPNSADEEPIMVVLTPDTLVHWAGQPKKPTATEWREWSQPGYQVITMTIKEYREARFKWIYDKPNDNEQRD